MMLALACSLLAGGARSAVLLPGGRAAARRRHATELLVLRGGQVPQAAAAEQPAVAPPPPSVAHDRTAVREQVEERYRALSYGLDPLVDVAHLADQVAAGLYDGASEREIEELAAETAAYQASMHPDYAKLAARVAVSRLHAQTEPSFVQTARALRAYADPVTGAPAPLVSAELVELAEELAEEIEPALRHELDYELDYFGLRTLVRAYLLGEEREGGVRERPQHMLMRVALCVHGRDAPAVLEAYELMSRGVFTHATPTMFNAGSTRQQLSSCFLLATRDDSIDGIFETLQQCALISRAAGGVGMSVSNVRAAQSYIRSTGGKSSGLVPMLRVFDATARFVDQGGGKRKGAFAVYLEPWHADTLDFLQLKKNHGKEEARARDLFYALWVPDLFMKRVEAGGDWSLFCPNETPGMVDSWGEDFEKRYEQYEAEGRARRTVKAQDLWFAILDAQIETGTPYMLYKDACNRKSNQQNLGTIRGSNLCTEIIEYTSPGEVAVCNLASIALPRFISDGAFDHQKLYDITYTVTRNLNRVIDNNYYPVPEARASNMRHRPVGLGVQGLADVFILLKLNFDGPAARQLNRDIFETIYFAALSASCDLAAVEGHYESYHENGGCPVSKGVLQFDMWGVKPTDRWGWDALRAKIAQHGVRNSLLVAPMPTASTAQILGNNECFEPYTSNLYSRRTLSGEFAVVNQHLLRDLMARGLWTSEIRNQIIAHNGSVQKIPEIPQDLKELYRTSWELKQRALIDMAADRGAFIDQSQSFNVFVQDPNYGKLSSMHFHGWKQGLKTGMYYLRSKAAADAIKFTVDQQQLQKKAVADAAAKAEPKRAEPEECLSCGA